MLVGLARDLCKCGMWDMHRTIVIFAGKSATVPHKAFICNRLWQGRDPLVATPANRSRVAAQARSALSTMFSTEYLEGIASRRNLV
jgi:hypothetical protein